MLPSTGLPCVPTIVLHALRSAGRLARGSTTPLATLTQSAEPPVVRGARAVEAWGAGTPAPAHGAAAATPPVDRCAASLRAVHHLLLQQWAPARCTRHHRRRLAAGGAAGTVARTCRRRSRTCTAVPSCSSWAPLWASSQAPGQNLTRSQRHRTPCKRTRAPLAMHAGRGAARKRCATTRIWIRRWFSGQRPAAWTQARCRNGPPQQRNNICAPRRPS